MNNDEILDRIEKALKNWDEIMRRHESEIRKAIIHSEQGIS